MRVLRPHSQASAQAQLSCQVLPWPYYFLLMDICVHVDTYSNTHSNWNHSSDQNLSFQIMCWIQLITWILLLPVFTLQQAAPFIVYLIFVFVFLNNNVFNLIAAVASGYCSVLRLHTSEFQQMQSSSMYCLPAALWMSICFCINCSRKPAYLDTGQVEDSFVGSVVCHFILMHLFRKCCKTHLII